MKTKAAKGDQPKFWQTTVTLTQEQRDRLREIAAEALRRGDNPTVSAALRGILDKGLKVTA